MPRICFRQIAALHLASKVMIGAGALNELGLFVFNELLMKDRQNREVLEKSEREHSSAFLPLLSNA